MERPGRFVGIGIDTYEAHEPLEHAPLITVLAEASHDDRH